MAQLGFFSRSVIASMRDWSGVPSHSPEMVEFRRGQDERRRWGLKRRHALKLCRLHGCSRLCGELGLHDSTERIPPLVWDDEISWVRRPMTASRPDGVPQTSQASCPKRPVEADTVVRAEPAAQAGQAVRTEPATQAEQAVRTEPATQAEQAVRIEPATPPEAEVRAEPAVEAETARRPESTVRGEVVVRIEAMTPRRPKGPAKVAARAESTGLSGFSRVARERRSGHSISGASHSSGRRRAISVAHYPAVSSRNYRRQ
ncbi:hypothetical protein ACFY36_06790 [Actinoplanes sp. NPDC000266]